MKKFVIVLISLFSINSYANNEVWFECGEVGRKDNEKEFIGYPIVLGYIHDLPKTAIEHVTEITYINTTRVAWQTGTAISDGKVITILMKTATRDIVSTFDREQLTFNGIQCKISDEETVIKKRDEMIEIQLGLNKI